MLKADLFTEEGVQKCTSILDKLRGIHNEETKEWEGLSIV